MLKDKILKYSQDDVYPFHMPGHKRNTTLLTEEFPYNLDITEIHGFDDLRYLKAELGEIADLAARLYKSKKAFLLINGSTVGILTGIGAFTKQGDKILFTKSCHRSVYNATDLFGLESVFLIPGIDESSDIENSVTPEMVEDALKQNLGIKLVVITSPSYEGVISDVKSITDVCHNFDVTVLIDSAHGAHLGFSKGFPDSAVSSGADVVVMSLHKTLPALTQCSLLHVCNDRVDLNKIYKLLFTLQTSSPSYVLMASIDYCLRLLDSYRDKLFSDYEKRLSRFYTNVKDMKHLSVIDPGKNNFYESHPGFYDFDPGKIVIITKNTNMSKDSIAEILRKKYKIELEITHPNFAIAITSICDTDEGFNRLANALNEIDSCL